MAVFREFLNESSASATAALRDGMHGPVTHKCGRRIPYAGRSRFAGPSPSASGRDREGRSSIFRRKMRPRSGMHGPVIHKCGRRIPYAGRSRFAGPSPCASGRDRVALLGIVDQATTCVVRLVIIPILSATCPHGIYSEVPWGITKRVKGVKHDVFNNRSCRRSADGQLPGSGTRCQR